MRILFVTNEMPGYTGGMPVRDIQLLKALASRHDFTLVCFADGDPASVDAAIAAVRPYCEDVVTVPRPAAPVTRWQARANTARKLLKPEPASVSVLCPPVLRQTVRQCLGSGPYDILHVNHVEMGPLLQLAVGSARLIGIEVLTPKLRRMLPFNTKLSRRLVAAVELRKVEVYERRLFARADLCTMASETEMATVKTMAPEARTVVIPNGVDTVSFRGGHVLSSVGEPPSILFVGTMPYAPNEDAVFYFHRSIWPLVKARLPGVRWRIVGRGPSPAIRALAAPDVEVTGEVPDVRPYLATSTVMVVPLRAGGGTRLKILEAMAAGLPVVSTTVGAEGLAVRGGEHLLISDTPEGFADAVAMVAGDPDQAARLSTAARDLVAARYDWRRIADCLDDAYRSVVVRRSPG